MEGFMGLLISLRTNYQHSTAMETNTYVVTLISTEEQTERHTG